VNRKVILHPRATHERGQAQSLARFPAMILDVDVHNSPRRIDWFVCRGGEAMADLSDFEPTDRFSGLAGRYAQFRPGYPEGAIDYILARCGLREGAVLADIGCGTGISSRLFAERGLSVVGVEPNAKMRAQAESTGVQRGRTPTYREGTAEATRLPAGCADAVLAAQAFHWFRSENALAEFHRVLKPAGWAVLMWNERSEADPFTAAYGGIIRSFPEAAAVEMPRGRAREALWRSALFEQPERVAFSNAQVLDEAGLIGRAFSASYAPREEGLAQAAERALRELFSRYQRHARVTLHYETSIYTGRRREPSTDG
jgi:ubiquinone/menaquinone biosynthesis C-methylase UbiE